VVSKLFETIDSSRDSVPIVDWGVKGTTMEDGEGRSCSRASIRHLLQHVVQSPTAHMVHHTHAGTPSILCLIIAFALFVSMLHTVTV